MLKFEFPDLQINETFVYYYYTINPNHLATNVSLVCKSVLQLIPFIKML